MRVFWKQSFKMEYEYFAWDWYCQQCFCHLNKIAVNKIGFMLEYKSNEVKKAAVSCLP